MLVLLLTRARLHVAGVVVRAAVLAVGAADGLRTHSTCDQLPRSRIRGSGTCCGPDLDQGAAAPVSLGQFAARRPSSAAALVVTFHVGGAAGLGPGSPFAEPGHDLGALGAGRAVGLTGVAAGAAVVPVVTANSLETTSIRYVVITRRVPCDASTLTLGSGQQPHSWASLMKQQVVSLGQLVWESHMFSAV